MIKRFVTPMLQLPHMLYTLRGRLALSIILLLILYTALLTVSFETTINTRTLYPIGTIFQGDAIDEYIQRLTENPDEVLRIERTFTATYLRDAIFRNSLILLFLGGISAYWLSGRMLHPLRRFAQTTQHINAKTLATRLDIPTTNDELKTLAHSFNGMLERLEYAFVRQEQFVSGAAHELRTPLATLRATLETLPSATDMTPNDYHEMTQTFARTLTRIEKLVASLLILATDEQSIADDEIVLGPLVEEILHDLAPLASAHFVTVTYGGEAHTTVRGAPSLVSLVLTNLIENGIRYNRAGGSVYVAIDNVHNAAMVRVIDTGIGLSASEQQHIFDRFYRVDSSRPYHTDGAGLGLALVDHIIRHYGGTITVESHVGKGSTFTITLPQ